MFCIIYAESGLFIGFFLPGDSLLFTAGFLASQGFLDIKLLILVTFIAAVLGDNFGYAFGRKVGPKIFKKKDSLLFHQNNLKKAKAFYEKYGAKAIVLARFMPVIRTFAPILAGVGSMNWSVFAFYNIIGGMLWTLGLSLLGYFLGSTIPNIDRYLLPIILLIIFLSILPTLIHILKDKNHRTQIFQFIGKYVPGLRFERK